MPSDPSNRNTAGHSIPDRPEQTVRRLDELEVKAAFADEALDQLNAVIIRQQAQIERLQRDLDSLRHQMAAQAPDGSPSLRDELPPHY